MGCRASVCKAEEGARSGRSAVEPESVGPGVATARPAAGIVDLFAGIGCVADAFGARGFEVLALLDVDADAPAHVRFLIASPAARVRAARRRWRERPRVRFKAGRRPSTEGEPSEADAGE